MTEFEQAVADALWHEILCYEVSESWCAEHVAPRVAAAIEVVIHAYQQTVLQPMEPVADNEIVAFRSTDRTGIADVDVGALLRDMAIRALRG